MFDLCVYMWSLYVSSIDGMYWCNCLVVNNGNIVMYSTYIAYVRVVRVGNQRALCAKVMRLAMVGELIIEFSACMGCCGASVLFIVHSLDNPLVPCKIIFFSYMI